MSIENVTKLSSSESNDNSVSSSVDVNKLFRVVSQIVELEQSKKEIVGEIKESYANAKSEGYDVAALKKIVSLKLSGAHNKEKIEHEMNMFELYKDALGM